MTNKNEYNPPLVYHPGTTLEEKLTEIGMGPKEFALRTGKPEKTISAIIKGDSSITHDMALQFEIVTKIPVHFWINHQKSYDDYIARTKRQAVIDQAIEWSKKFPVSEMIKKCWINKSASDNEKAIELLSFFGFANHLAWHDYYCNQELKIVFRISLANTNDPYAISAWLRKGELQASELTSTHYSEKKFSSSLPEIKSIMSNQPADFFKQLQQVCLDAGVKVVYTSSLPKAPICGSTRWINDTPLIQLTGRYKRNDSFWFTFFHEAGHILLHGKKDVFLEKVNYNDIDHEKEIQADNFAVKWTLNEDQEKEIIRELPLNKEQIKHYAKKFSTHPAIIIGRLQHNKLVPYSFGTEFIEQIVLE